MKCVFFPGPDFNPTHSLNNTEMVQNLANSVKKLSTVASQRENVVKYVCLCHQPFTQTNSNKTARYCNK